MYQIKFAIIFSYFECKTEKKSSLILSNKAILYFKPHNLKEINTKTIFYVRT